MNSSVLKNLVTGIVDYAGLFPPAKLDMATVVKNYHSYLASENNWMLSRLVIPASRLVEFEDAAGNLLPLQGQPWRLSVLIPPFSNDRTGFLAGIEQLEAFNEKHGQPQHGRAIGDVIETLCPAADDWEDFQNSVPENIAAFVELPLNEDLERNVAQLCALIDSMGRSRFFAKIRTGGVKQEMIPEAASVARFIQLCGEYLLPFKATAGLHHPWRGEYRLTYEEAPEIGTMYGYLNVFSAACFAFSGNVSLVDLQALLTDEGSELKFTRDEIQFRGLRVSASRVAQIRKKLLFSFGSCSFDEPTCELHADARFAS